MIIVALGGMVTACILWRRAPLSSLLVMIACASSIALLLVYPLAYELIVHFFATNARTLAEVRTAFGMFWSLVRAAYLILLVIAVYVGRQRPGRRPES